MLFALYNGLVFLPVLLSLFGPPPRPDLKFEDSEMKEIPAKNSNQNLEEPEVESFVRQSGEDNSIHENATA